MPAPVHARGEMNRAARAVFTSPKTKIDALTSLAAHGQVIVGHRSDASSADSVTFQFNGHLQEDAIGWAQKEGAVCTLGYQRVIDSSQQDGVRYLGYRIERDRCVVQQGGKSLTVDWEDENVSARGFIIPVHGLHHPGWVALLEIFQTDPSLHLIHRYGLNYRQKLEFKPTREVFPLKKVSRKVGPQVEILSENFPPPTRIVELSASSLNDPICFTMTFPSLRDRRLPWGCGKQGEWWIHEQQEPECVHTVNGIDFGFQHFTSNSWKSKSKQWITAIFYPYLEQFGTASYHGDFLGFVQDKKLQLDHPLKIALAVLYYSTKSWRRFLAYINAWVHAFEEVVQRWSCAEDRIVSENNDPLAHCQTMQLLIAKCLSVLDEARDNMDLICDAAKSKTSSLGQTSIPPDSIKGLGEEFDRIAALLKRRIPCLETYEHKLHSQRQDEIKRTQFEDSRKAVQQGESIKRLTVIAFLFIPVSTVATLFGMNIQELDDAKPSWQYAAKCCAVTLLVTLPLAKMRIKDDLFSSLPALDFTAWRLGFEAMILYFFAPLVAFLPRRNQPTAVSAPGAMKKAFQRLQRTFTFAAAPIDLEQQ